MGVSMQFIRLLALGVSSAALIVAGNGGGSGGSGNPGGGGATGVTPAGAAEVRTLSERIPAGGTVQVKYLFTQPRPITGGAARFSMYSLSIDGVSISSPLGTTAGAAVVNNGVLSLSILSPDGDFGTNLDYPFLMLTMDVPASTPAGTSFPLDVLASELQSPTGPLTLTDPKPGVLTVGGSLSINGVFPGGGTLPSGTSISIRGTGFQAGTKVVTKMKTSSPLFVSSNEIRLVLQETVVMDTQKFVVSNPDGSQVSYYSYLRGTPVQKPSRELLLRTEPIFQTQTHGTATVGPLPAAALGGFVAVAVQNPSTGPVSVTFQVQSTGATASVVLPAGGRIMEELSALLGTAVGPNDVVTINATSAVQILGLSGNEIAGIITPFLPTF